MFDCWRYILPMLPLSFSEKEKLGKPKEEIGNLNMDLNTCALVISKCNICNLNICILVILRYNTFNLNILRIQISYFRGHDNHISKNFASAFLSCNFQQINLKSLSYKTNSILLFWALLSRMILEESTHIARQSKLQKINVNLISLNLTAKHWSQRSITCPFCIQALLGNTQCFMSLCFLSSSKWTIFAHLHVHLSVIIFLYLSHHHLILLSCTASRISNLASSAWASWSPLVLHF